MTSVVKMFDSTKLFIAMCVWLTFWVGTHLIPVSLWYEVTSVKVADARAGQQVPMVVVREIHRPFVGAWRVSIRRWGESGWHVLCQAHGVANYRSGSELPNNLTLDWWTGGDCQTLPPGRYVISTGWTIKPEISFIPEKTILIDSNIFEVEP